MSLTISETDSLQNHSGGDEIQIYPTYLTYSFYSFYPFFPFCLFYSLVGSDETQLNYDKWSLSKIILIFMARGYETLLFRSCVELQTQAGR